MMSNNRDLIFKGNFWNKKNNLSKIAHISIIVYPTKLSLAWDEDIGPEKGPT